MVNMYNLWAYTRNLEKYKVLTYVGVYKMYAYSCETSLLSLMAANISWSIYTDDQIFPIFLDKSNNISLVS